MLYSNYINISLFHDNLVVRTTVPYSDKQTSNLDKVTPFLLEIFPSATYEAFLKFDFDVQRLK